LTLLATTPPAQPAGDIQINVSINGDARHCVGAGSGLRMLGNPIKHRQLQDGHALPFAELRHQHMASIRKFDRIMVTMRNIRVDLAEFPNPEID
jgi:hypothetical protein